MNWIVMGSRTFSEVNEVRKALGRDPDLIITNKEDLKDFNRELLFDCTDKIVFLPRKPQIEDYNRLEKKYPNIFKDCIITCHGYLRIIPAEWCEKFRIVNGHPGQILDYPELKGFDPQKRAYEGHYKTAGSVIHNVTAGVDEGEIILHDETSIEGLTLDEVFETLHNISINLWIKYLKKELY